MNILAQLPSNPSINGASEHHQAQSGGRDTYPMTRGGVPVPSEAYDGTFINHPDTDLADPTMNTSGVPWQTLYYKANYPRLQQIKARWDPRNVFRHALSIPVA